LRRRSIGGAIVYQHRYQTIFRIALILTCITVSASLLIIRVGGIHYIGWYPLIVEAAALVLYLFFLRRPKKEVSFA
jgi:CHASE2 domain-containing sensor protein